MRVGIDPDGSVSRVSGSDLDLSALGRRLWEKKWKILGPSLVVAGLSFVAVNMITPKYRSEARVLIEGRENIFLRPEADKNPERVTIDPETMASQVQVLLSQDLARKVIKQTKLTELPEFDPVLNGVSLPSVMLSMLGLAKDRLKMTPEERVLEVYYSRLTVLPVERSRVISVDFQSADPELAARVTNAIVDSYLTLQQETRIEQTRAASQWLAGEIENLREKVAEAEGKVEQYRSKSNLFLGANNTSLMSQQLGELTAQLATARAQKADIDSRSRIVRELLRSGGPVESSDFASSEIIRRINEQRIVLRTQLAEQSSTLLSEHPRIKELKAQIAGLDSQVRGELDRISRSLDNDSRISGARVESLIANIDQLKRDAAAKGDQDVQLRALEREAKAQRDLLESYLAKYREATARESIDVAPTDARIISRATASNTPSYPKKIPIILISTLTMMFLAMTFVTAGEFLSAGAYQAPSGGAGLILKRIPMFDFLRRRKAGSETQAAAASIIPAAPSMQGLLSGVPIGEMARNYRSLGEAAKRITVVGAARNVGTTHTAIGLSRILAQDARVVLVDLAFGAPNLSIISTQPSSPGIADLIRGKASFGSIITRDQFSRVHLISTGMVEPEGFKLFASPRLAMTLEALARSYDHVVIDAGSLSESPIEPIARIAPRAVLVATDLDHPETRAARDRLVAAGFIDVKVFLGTPQAPSSVAA